MSDDILRSTKRVEISRQVYDELFQTLMAAGQDQCFKRYDDLLNSVWAIDLGECYLGPAKVGRIHLVISQEEG